MPVYQLLSTEALKGLEDAAVATTASSDEAGDYYNMAVATKVPVAEVSHNAIILVPLSATADGAVMTSTSLAAGPTMYVRLNGLPQLRMVFGTCVGYSDDSVDKVIATSTLVKFPPPEHLFVAKEVLVDALAALVDTVDEAGANCPKRRIPEGQMRAGNYDFPKEENPPPV